MVDNDDLDAPAVAAQPKSAPVLPACNAVISSSVKGVLAVSAAISSASRNAFRSSAIMPMSTGTYPNFSTIALSMGRLDARYPGVKPA